MTDIVADEDLPGGLAYFEWCADDGADPYDVKAIAQANPALGTRLTLGFINGVEREELTEEEFAAERLGLWSDDVIPIEAVIPEDAWARCLATRRGALSDHVAWAIDAAPDLRSAAIGVSDGTTIVVAEHHPSTSWLAPKLAQLLTDRPGPVFWDPKSPTGALIEELDAAGITPIDVTPAQHAQACGALLAAALHVPGRGKPRKLIHRGQPALDRAVAGATRRNYGEAWAWNRRTSRVDISPLVAVTLARWGAQQPRPATYSGPLVAVT